MKKIAIICAIQEELDGIIQTLNLDPVTSINNHFVSYTAKYLSYDLVFALCGIGKVNSAIHTQYLIDNNKLDFVINLGVAGSLLPELSFGDVVIARDLVHHDVDVTAFGLVLGQIPRMDVFSFDCCKHLLKLSQKVKHIDYKIVVGRIATGDQFIDNKLRAEFISATFQASACEMEGAAIAQTCYTNQVPFIVIRALSDMAGRHDTATYSFNQLKEMAANRSSFVVKELLGLI